jgi:hypothetical protein
MRAYFFLLPENPGHCFYACVLVLHLQKPTRSPSMCAALEQKESKDYLSKKHCLKDYAPRRTNLDTRGTRFCLFRTSCVTNPACGSASSVSLHSISKQVFTKKKSRRDIVLLPVFKRRDFFSHGLPSMFLNPLKGLCMIAAAQREFENSRRF